MSKTKVAHKRIIMLFWSGMVRKKKIIITSLSIIAFLIVLAGVGFFYYQYQQARNELSGIRSGMTDEEKEVKALVSEVGKLMALPEVEDPKIAVVSDIDKLKDQNFFQKAKNGDKVLIYASARKAILYDPIAKKIIDVAPINIGSSSAEVKASATSTPKLQEVKIIVRNGTDVTGLATKMSTQIKSALAEANIIKKENASRFNFDKTLVVVQNEAAKSYADTLAVNFKASVTTLPDGESKAEGADLLIILGLDKAQ